MTKLRIADISLPLDGTEQDLKRLAAKRLHVKPEAVKFLKLARRSVDARRKNDVHFIVAVECECPTARPGRDPKITPAVPCSYRIEPVKQRDQRPVVVGFGPAGMFAALFLARAGQRPLVVERGAPVEEREKAVERFWSTGCLDPESNVQFGEGGAGTFSDGKLNTGIKDPRARFVLEELAAAGAPQEILWQAKPHIGTDRLPGVVRFLREAVQSLGGQILFHTRLTGLFSKNGRVTGIELNQTEKLETDRVILAVGHSARDTFLRLYETGIIMEQKPFSVGVRIEHRQGRIDAAQYGSFAGDPALGAADYKLFEHLPSGRGVYTFCMCPGGSVVAAASEEGRLVTNGMSRFARDGENANSALLVGINPADTGAAAPLAGMAFQRRLEEAAFRLGGESYFAPVQRVGDFLHGVKTTQLGEVRPTYCPGVTPCALDGCLPEFVAQALRQAIPLLGKRLPGFADPDAVLTAVEGRSSSPVRIVREKDFFSPSLHGLIPCGEGAGYAGGIVSAAVDGLRCAEMALKKETNHN